VICVSEPRITLYTRPGCHLCDAAKTAVDEIARRTGETWREIDVTGDPELESEYGEMLPVIMIDQKMHGYWRVEPERLVRDLGHS
jgi:glutaredoxin